MKIIDTSKLLLQSDLDGLSTNYSEWVYNGLDCAVTFEVLENLLEELDPVSERIYQRSLSLRAPILEMSVRGLLVDVFQRERVRRDFEKQLAIVLDQFNRLLIEGLGVTAVTNWRSPVQIKNLFYNVLGLRPIKKRNANGIYAPTVDADALEKLQNNFWAMPLASLLLTARELDKRITFLKKPLDADGRLRSTFNIAGTVTGRLSSSASEFGTGINQQNIDRALRSIFIPTPGYKYINIDLEQGDSRNLAAFCWEVFVESDGEEYAGSYLNACESADLHTTVANMTWPELLWPADKNDIAAMKAVAEVIFYRQDSYRQTAKKLGHGTNYLGTPYTMAHHAKMPRNVIEDFQRRYFLRFPVIGAFHKWVEQQLQDYANITTLHGRRRYFFGRPDDKATLREAVAYAGQSMTADAVNKGMINLWIAREAKKYDIRFICQVHDSLLLEVPTERCDELVPIILEATQAPLTLKRDRRFIVPNEAKIGWNWGDRTVDKKTGKVDNELGLIKWKGNDTRQAPSTTLSLAARLGIK